MLRRCLSFSTALLVILQVLAFGFTSATAVAQSSPRRIVTIRDAETEQFIRRLVDPLLRTAGLDPSMVRLTLIQDRAINAFVSTGNRLFIHTGLIQQATGVAELAGVLAHETGHIAAGHLARLPEEMRNAMIRAAAAMLLGGAAGVASGSSGAAAAGIVGGQAAAMGEFFAFTRQQEQAADQAGVTYMERMGWTTRGLERLLERLLDQELLSVGRQDPYFRTHPLSRDRLEFIREHLSRSRHADTPMPAEVEQGYAMVRAKLDGFIESPMTVWRRWPESDTSAPARYARAIALFRSHRVPEAVALIDGLIRENPTSPWLHELKGQVLFESGAVRDAAAPYAQAARLAPSEGLIRLSFAGVMIELGDPASLRRAVSELEAALDTERESSFVWRQMAVAQGRLGNLPMADLALAEEALLQGDARAARMLATRAEQALPPGPLRLRAQDLKNAAAPDNLPPGMRRR